MRQALALGALSVALLGISACSAGSGTPGVSAVPAVSQDSGLRKSFSAASTTVSAESGLRKSF